MTTSTRTKPKPAAKPAENASTPLTGKAKEDYDKRVAAQTEAPKRKVYSASERIAKLEAELLAAREAGQTLARKKVEKLSVQRDALNTRRQELTVKINAIDAEIDALADQPETDTV